MTVLEETPVLRRAVFPVKVTLPDGTAVALGKLFVTDAAVYVYVNAPGDPELVYESLYTAAVLPPTFAPRSDAFRIDTPDGQLVAYRLPGCGCHLRVLKNYVPFTPLRVGRV